MLVPWCLVLHWMSWEGAQLQREESVSLGQPRVLENYLGTGALCPALGEKGSSHSCISQWWWTQRGLLDPLPGSGTNVFFSLDKVKCGRGFSWNIVEASCGEMEDKELSCLSFPLSVVLPTHPRLPECPRIASLKGEIELLPLGFSGSYLPVFK